MTGFDGIDIDFTGEIAEEKNVEDEKPKDEKPEAQEEKKEGLDLFLKEEKPEEKPDRKPEEKPEEKPKSNAMLSFAKALKEDGVWEYIEDDEIAEAFGEDGGADVLAELNKKEIERKFDGWKGSLTENEQERIDAADAGADMRAYDSYVTTIEQLDGIGAAQIKESEELQKSLLKNRMIIGGYTEAEADGFVKDAEDTGSLEKKAGSALNYLKDYYVKQKNDMIETQNKQKERQEQQITEQKERMKTKVDELEDFAGAKINKTTKDKIYNSLTKVVGYKTLPNGAKQPMNKIMQMQDKNPEEFAIMLASLIELGVINFDGSGKMKPDVSRLTGNAKKKAMEEFEQTMNKRAKDGGETPDTQKQHTILDIG